MSYQSVRSRENGRSYVVLKDIFFNQMLEDDYKMITIHSLENIAPITMKKFNNEETIWYDITNTVNLLDYITTHRLHYTEIQKILHQILETAKRCNDYLLSENSLLLEPNYIYMDLCTFHCLFLYVPIIRESKFLDEFRQLLYTFLNHIDAKDERGLHLLHQLKIISEEDTTGLISMRELLIEPSWKKEEINSPTDKLWEIRELPEKENGTVKYKRFSLIEKLKALPKKLQVNTLHKNETTQIVHLNDKKTAYMITRKNVKIPLLTTPFLIGSDKKSDLYLESKFSSKLHGRIVYSKGDFFIIDENSRKGTYLNHKQIERNKPFKIQNNSKLIFDEEEFVFRLI